MGMVCGKIKVETPKFEVVESTGEYEIRKYGPCVTAEFTYDRTQLLKGNKYGEYMILINYLVGAFGLENPQNTKPEKIDITPPVVTKIKNMGSSLTPFLIVSPVTFQTILPEKYKKAEDAPQHERVVIREEGERKYGVLWFTGVPKKKKVAKKAEKLNKDLERDGFKVVGKYLLGTYNPPCTWPMFWPNEVMIPVE